MIPDYAIYGYVFLATCGLSFFGTLAMRRVALRLGVLDQPGERKVHKDPVPLLGGVAIVGAFYLFALSHIAGLAVASYFGVNWLENELLLFLGEDAKVKFAGILAGGFVIFTLGVVDDLMVLTPWVKLFGQIVAAAVLVLSGLRIEMFVFSNLWISAGVTILWVVLLTNSLNFLDNMDGLCAGVSIIACLSFFLCVQTDDTLVRVILMLLAGAAGGFLYFNLNPARIFMGDAGAMFCGYMLATVTVLGTFHVESTPSRIAVAAPLLALSVPLFDTLSVVYIRWRSGQHIMLGDKRHFSHRLVDLGMSHRQAVEFIYLVAAVVGLGAALLPMLDLGGTLIIIAQTVGVYLLIVLLMRSAR